MLSSLLIQKKIEDIFFLELIVYGCRSFYFNNLKVYQLSLFLIFIK